MSIFSRLFSRWRDGAKGWVADRVRWVCDVPRDLFGKTPTRRPWVVIWGRDQYDVSVERVPIQNWFEARRATQLLKEEGGWSLATLGSWNGSCRSVYLYRIKPGRDDSLSAPFWFFETELLSGALDSGRVFSIDRFGFRYFLAPPDRSQVAGSLIDDPKLFALSAGASEQAISDRPLEQQDLFALLNRGLFRVRLAGWIQSFNPALWSRVVKMTPTAVGLAAAILIVYLFASTAYLLTVKSLREKQLAALGPEVAELLRAQRDMESLSKRVNSVVTVVNSRVDSFRAWSLVPLVWDSGGVINGLAFKDGRVLIRGATADATSLLSQISRDTAFYSVKFEAPLRESSGRQEFSIGAGLSGAKSP